MRIFDKIPHIDFMKYKTIAMSISWGLIVVCILFAQPWKGTKGRVKLGMQFVGGIDMQVRFRGEAPQSKVREALLQGGIQDAAVVAYKAPEGFVDYSIKVKAPENQDAKEATAQTKKIHAALRKLDPSAANDTRPDLNTEALQPFVDRWAKENPLKFKGDDLEMQRYYQDIVTKIANTRTKLAPLQSFDQLPGDIPKVLLDQIKAEYRIGNMAELKNESFSPSVSGEWTRKTLTAVAWAMGAIMLYVVFRFTWSFSVAGIIALFHDVLMALAIFTFCGFEYSVPVVGSFLVLIGYSMSDTIVIFDRIRENTHRPEYRRATITQLINDSINQTISRTLLTSVCVFFAAFCLFMWGGPALRDLSFPIMIGIITGTYSSIYIAGPVLVWWEKWFPRQDSLKQKHA